METRLKDVSLHMPAMVLMVEALLCSCCERMSKEVLSFTSDFTIISMFEECVPEDRESVTDLQHCEPFSHLQYHPPLSKKVEQPASISTNLF